MKKLLLIIVALVLYLSCFAQQQRVIITLKNGTTITGNVKELEPLSHVVIDVVGIVSRIEMSNVVSISPIQEEITPNPVIPNHTVLPADTIVNIAGIDIKFILIEGGTFEYGYDGRHSRALKSEPVHDVTLSPFYISEKLIMTDLVNAVLSNDTILARPFVYNKKEYKELFGVALLKALGKNEKKSENYISKGFFNANFPSASDFINELNKICSIKFSIPTETQWFYLSTGQCSDSKNIDIPLPSELVMGVSMTEKYNPQGLYYTVRGITTFSAELAKFDRNANCTYGIINNKITMKSNVTFYGGPFHLVFYPQ